MLAIVSGAVATFFLIGLLHMLGVDIFRGRLFDNGLVPSVLIISTVYLAGLLLEMTGLFAPRTGGPHAFLRRQIEAGAVDGRAGRSSELFAEFLRRHGPVREEEK